MAAESTSFAAFVQESRDKKKNEVLAQQFLGRGRKTAASGAGLASNKPRSGSQRPSLLSRISSAGVTKRATSAKPSGVQSPATSIDGKWQHDLHRLNNPAAPQSATAARRTYDKFAPLLDRRPAARSADAGGFSIRGVASGGPYTVIASNFAPGTTAADIEAVMAPVGGETLGCRLISAAPTVMVELQFVDKQGADNVIATFNNQKADGRLLYVYLKDVPASHHLAHSRPSPARLPQSDNVDMDMDGDAHAGARGGNFQDGRFGFGEGGRKEPPRGPRRRY